MDFKVVFFTTTEQDLPCQSSNLISTSMDLMKLFD